MNTAQSTNHKTRVRRFAPRFNCSLVVPLAALVLMSVRPVPVLAQDDHEHSMAAQQQELTPEQASRQAALVKAVRDSTERFKDVHAAEAAGYALQFGCVSGPDSGAMGLHYINGDLVKAGEVNVTRPQIVIYEARKDGSLQLIGADFLVFADAWDKTHPGTPPELMGQLFHYWESPNRFGLPAFYTLHVWAWKANPNGAFVNWHPKVSCESFSAQKL